MARRTLALLALLTLLSLGLEGCHSRGGGPCCWKGDAELVAAGDAVPCCEPSAPPTLQEASASPKGAFHPALAASFALTPPHFAAAERAVSRGSATRPRLLYRLDCTLLL